MDGNNPTITTCNPKMYAQYVDPHTGSTYFAVQYLTGGPQNFSANPAYYSIGYELVKQVSDATNHGANPASLSGVQLLDVLRTLYYYWSQDPYFSPEWQLGI